uniref:Uncharacterized protein n=1 Tax=Aegilops tauschii subsp. strangulata TaxID=200361 RepID=A0A453RHY1_AEGTS
MSCLGKTYSFFVHDYVSNSTNNISDSFPFRYFTIQLGRMWDEMQNRLTKKFDKVSHPLQLDLYGHCSDEMKLKLQAAREVALILLFRCTKCEIQLKFRGNNMQNAK